MPSHNRYWNILYTIVTKSMMNFNITAITFSSPKQIANIHSLPRCVSFAIFSNFFLSISTQSFSQIVIWNYRRNIFTALNTMAKSVATLWVSNIWRAQWNHSPMFSHLSVEFQFLSNSIDISRLSCTKHDQICIKSNSIWITLTGVSKLNE